MAAADGEFLLAEFFRQTVVENPNQIPQSRRPSHLYIEFPPAPVELGEEYPVYPAEIPVANRILKLLSPTDCMEDRLGTYIHWKLRDCFRQAVLVAMSQQERVDLENLAAWCKRAGGSAAFDELMEHLAEKHPAA